MTCFWDGLYQSLNSDERDIVDAFRGDTPAKKMCKYLKECNVPVMNIKVNSSHITAKQVSENYNHIQTYSSQDIHLGKFVSTFDPFIMLFCEIFSVNVQHTYDGYIIEYNNKFYTNGVVYFSSNPGHFWFVKRE